eukprot:278775_1
MESNNITYDTLPNNALLSNATHISTTNSYCGGCTGEMQCGQITTGNLNSLSDIKYYYVNLSLDISSVMFDSCGSNYDTYLYLFDLDYNILYTSEYFSLECNPGTQLFIDQLQSYDYILGISGLGSMNNHTYGNWTMNMACETMHPQPNSLPAINCDKTLTEVLPTSKNAYYYFNLSTNTSKSVLFNLNPYIYTYLTSDVYLYLFDIKYNKLYQNPQLFIPELE